MTGFHVFFILGGPGAGRGTWKVKTGGENKCAQAEHRLAGTHLITGLVT